MIRRCRKALGFVSFAWSIFPRRWRSPLCRSPISGRSGDRRCRRGKRVFAAVALAQAGSIAGKAGRNYRNRFAIFWARSLDARIGDGGLRQPRRPFPSRSPPARHPSQRGSATPHRRHPSEPHRPASSRDGRRGRRVLSFRLRSLPQVRGHNRRARRHRRFPSSQPRSRPRRTSASRAPG